MVSRPYFYRATSLFRPYLLATLPLLLPLFCFKRSFILSNQNIRGDWERMRMNATITIQPHLKKKVTPRQVLPFPWEESKKKAEAPKVSAEEARKRFERLKKLLG